MRKISARGIAEIAAHEGIVPSPYKDSTGVWTIGIGHTAAAGPPDPERMPSAFTLAEIIELFVRDLARSEARVRQAFTRPLSQSAFDAAVSFDFNTGAIDRAIWVRLFNAGQDAGAHAAFLNWRRPPEILQRRHRERDLFFDGIYSGDGTAMLYPADRSGKVRWNSGERIDVLALLGNGSSRSLAARLRDLWIRLTRAIANLLA